MEISIDNPASKLYFKGVKDNNYFIQNEETQTLHTLQPAFILSPNQFSDHWNVNKKTFMDLSKNDFENFYQITQNIQNNVDVFILGTGDTPALASDNLYFEEFCADKNIQIDLMTNQSACRAFNFLASEGRVVICGVI